MRFLIYMFKFAVPNVISRKLILQLLKTKKSFDSRPGLHVKFMFCYLLYILQDWLSEPKMDLDLP